MYLLRSYVLSSYSNTSLYFLSTIYDFSPCIPPPHNARVSSLSLSLSLVSLSSRFFRLDHSVTRSKDRFRPCKIRASAALLVLREISVARNNDDDNVNCHSSRARSVVTTAREHMSRERMNGAKRRPRRALRFDQTNDRKAGNGGNPAERTLANDAPIVQRTD